MQQTVNEAVECHRKLWHGIANEISENGFRYNGPGQLKNSIIKKLFPELAEDEIENKCFLCEFTGCVCGKCPLVVTEPRKCLNGLYSDFLGAFLENNKKKAIQYAEKIANLPIINQAYGG